MTAAGPPVAPERLAMFADRVTGYDRTLPGFAAAWQEMAGKILAHGGTVVVPPLEDQDCLVCLRDLLAKVRKLAADGAEQVPSRVKLLRGQRSRCHVNTARLVLGLARRKGTGAAGADGIGTGYALNGDGLWRGHSWALDGDVLIETTERRTGYWGLVLRGGDAVRWAESVMS